MAAPANVSPELDPIEREKSIQKDAELQVENAPEVKGAPVDGEEVHITAKTWWVIFVSAINLIKTAWEIDEIRSYHRRSGCRSGQFQRLQQ